jgi:Flp pilus assembly pilin Flp
MATGSQQSRRRFRPARRDDGASSVEYAIVVGFIAAVAAAAVYGLGKVVELMYLAGKGAFG